MKTKTIQLSITVALLLNIAQPINLNADVLESSKKYAEKAMFWKKEKATYNFKDIYPKSFYKKSYFAPTAIAAAIAGGVAISFVTAGTGAPAAAVGVSSFATAVAGGGAGSYLAGLAAVGSWFGGGMVLGGAILNGIVLGTMVGAPAALANMTIQQKVEASALITAMGMDGIVYFKNPETGKNEYRIRLEIPQDIGSKEVKKIVDNIYSTNKDLMDAVKNNDATRQKAINESIKLYVKAAMELLKSKISTNNFKQDDLIVLSVIAWRNGNFDMFEKAIAKVNLTIDNRGFTSYLKALDYLKNNDIKNTLALLDKSRSINSYALEPIILKINILSNEDFAKNEIEIDKLVQYAATHFDADKYSTFLNLTSLYYRVGTIYFSNQKYAQAKAYYQKSFDDLGLLQKNFFGKQLKHSIELAIANSLYAAGEDLKADKIYFGIIDDIDDAGDKDGLAEFKKIKESYIGIKR